ncbi:MAG: OmpA family protein [Limnobacter sp.]|nr:OmpA family protein [Limnobacter sp.]
MKYIQTSLILLIAAGLSACATSHEEEQVAQEPQQETTVEENVRLPSALITRAQPEPPKPVMITLSASDNFEFDKAKLSQQGIGELNKAILKMELVSLEAISIVGHTDSIGSEEYNEDLSMRRAKSVKDYLTARGVPANLISVDGMGEAQPVASNKTAEGRAQNRRVEISFTVKQG